MPVVTVGMTQFIDDRLAGQVLQCDSNIDQSTIEKYPAGPSLSCRPIPLHQPKAVPDHRLPVRSATMRRPGSSTTR
jgi:hypothetical protein